MKNILVGLVLVGVFGCGPGEGNYVCTDNVFTEVAYPHLKNCDDSRRITDLAAQLLTISGMWVNPKANVPMYVQEIPSFPCLGDQRCWGMAYAFQRVEVGSTEIAVLHELFHMKDFQELNFSGHTNWDTNGRDALGNFYMFVLDDLVYWRGGDPCHDPPLTPQARQGISNVILRSPRTTDLNGQIGEVWILEREKRMKRHCDAISKTVSRVVQQAEM